MNDIRSLLGLTQLEMATYLGVSRSHYSMFESGKRRLPLKATQLLAELIDRLNVPSHSAQRSRVSVSQERSKNIQQLERLMRENAYQLLLIDKKINQAAKKQQLGISRETIVNNLSDQSDLQKREFGKIKTVIAKVREINPDQEAEILIRLGIKKEVLEFEKSLLDKRLNDLR